MEQKFEVLNFSFDSLLKISRLVSFVGLLSIQIHRTLGKNCWDAKTAPKKHLTGL